MAVAVSAEVMTAGETMVMTSVLLSSPSELVALMLMLCEPASEGVPVMVPVAASKLAHAGRPVAA